MRRSSGNQTSNCFMWLQGIVEIVATILFIVPACWAQIPQVSDATSTPMPGVGHDYLHMLSETVNPANGSLSVRINTPLPQGRGLTVPFSIDYNSDLDAWLGNNGWTGAQLNVNGWSQGFAQLWYNYDAAFEVPNPDTGIQPECDFTTDYVVELPDGEHWNLPISIAWTAVAPRFPPNDNVCADLGIANGPLTAQVGPLSVSASVVSGSGASIVVTTGDGTQYQFAQNLFQVNSQVAQFSLPTIVGRNGNIINTTGNNPASSQVSYTDTLGRTAVNSPGFGSGTSTLTVSGLGGPYTLVWSSITSTGVSAPLQLESYSGSTTAQNCWNSSPNVMFATNGQVLSSITLPNGQKYSFHYDPAYGLVNQITYPDGATVSYTWGVNQYSDTSVIANQAGTDPSQAWSCMWRYSTPVVTERKLYDNSFELLDQQFSYAATTFPDSTHDWSSKQTTVTDTDMVTNQSRQTIYVYQPASGGPYWAPNDNNYGSAIPVESQISYRTGPGTVLRTVTKTWLNERALSSQQTTLENGQSSLIVWCYNGNEQVSEKDEYDFGAISPSPSPCTGVSGAVSGQELRKTVTNYASFGSTHIVNRPSSVQVYDGSGNLAAETDYTYDSTSVQSVSPSPVQHDETNYSASFNTRGNATTVTRKCLQSCANAVSTYNYDETGQVVSKTDPPTSSCSSGCATVYSYADNYSSGTGTPPGNTDAYLTRVTYQQTNGVAHVTSFSYGYNDGQLRSSTDENSQTTRYQYSDSLDRLTETDYPDRGQTLISYNDAPPTPSITVSKKLNTSSQYVTNVSITNGLGLPIESELTSDPAGTDITLTGYDGLGRVYSVTNLYRSTGDPTYGVTYHYYDALGRETQVTHPDGTNILTTYTGRATEVTDEGNGTKGVQRISQSDGLGRLTSVCEVSGATQLGTTPTPAACGQDIGATGFLTSYAYDALGNLTGVTQGGLNSRTFAYDSLSRLTSATNPESGQTSYTYDANGNLLAKTDARAITTTYAYDALNRLSSKTYSDGTTPGANFTYDASSEWGVTLTNPIGRLVLESADNGHAMAIFSYDPMGRTANEWQCTPLNCGSGAFSLPYTYDLAGDDLTSSNGEGVTFTSTYNAAAQLTSMTSSLNDANHPGTLFSNATYNAPGQLTSDQLGNGITETRAYNSRLWMTSLVAGSAYNLSMTSYAPNGDILAANDSANGNWNYAYDDFNRLCASNQGGQTSLICTSTNNTGQQAYTYGYDRFSNRWKQTLTAGSGGTSSLTFSGNNNRVDGYSYDTAGNVLNDGSHGYTYDAENRIVTVDGGATTYVYDANGQRVRKTVGGASTDYVYDLAGHAIAEVNASGWQRGEVYAGGRHLATYANSTTYFDHGDWLGTERVRTAVNGSVCESITSLPFGDGESTTGSCADASTRHFTAKERDAESGLDDFGARYYSANMGRFMSADWSADPMNVPYASFENPQSLNLYTYVLNNPTTSLDPDGHDQWVCGPTTGGSIDPYTGAMIVHANCHWEPDWFDLPGQWFTGLTNMLFGGNAWQGTKQVLWSYTGNFVVGLPLGMVADVSGGAEAALGAGEETLARSGLTISKHALQEAEADGVSKQAIEKVVQVGEKYYDPVNKSIVSVLKGGMASGKNIAVAQDSVSGTVKTVFTSSKSVVASRLIPIK